MLKMFFCSSAYLFGMLVSFFATAQTTLDEDKAKTSFVNIVKRCSNAYNQKTPDRVSDLSNGQFFRIGGSESKISFDISRTQSILSPLLGVVNVETTTYATLRFGTKEEAETAPLEPALFLVEKFSFSHQDGDWVFKTVNQDVFPIRNGVVGRKDMSITTVPKLADGEANRPSYVCAFGSLSK